MKSRTCPRCTGRGPWQGTVGGSGSEETSQGHDGLSGFVVLPPARPPVSSHSRGCRLHQVAGLSRPRFPGLPHLQREQQLSHPDGHGSRADRLTSSDPGLALGHPELRGRTSERSLDPSITRSPQARVSTGTGERPTTLLWDLRQLPFELLFSTSSHVAQSQISSYKHPSS